MGFKGIIMKILLLGYDSLLLWLKNKHNVVKHTSNPITLENIKGYDWIISWGYCHILTQDHIDAC